MTHGTWKNRNGNYDEINEVEMDVVSPINKKQVRFNGRIVIGLIFFISGGIILAAQFFGLPWITFGMPICVGTVLLFAAIRTRHTGYLVGGSIVFGLGLGICMAVAVYLGSGFGPRMGIGLIGVSAGFFAIPVFMYWTRKIFSWWALLVAAPLGATGLMLAITPGGVFDFILYVVTFVGLTFLAIGLNRKMIGFIIPGCLLIGIGPGISLAWGLWGGLNPLSSTGVMLVWFALGWGLITLISRIAFEKFVWWPLIPGGILGMVGWGLYIGGNPGNAMSFIGNTGSIGMIIFGLYLLLMRRGIRH